MNGTSSDGIPEDELLDRAVAIVLAEASPADVRERVLSRAALLTRGRLRRPYRNIVLSPIACTAAAIVLLAVGLLLGLRFGRDQPAGDREKPMSARSHGAKDNSASPSGAVGAPTAPQVGDDSVSETRGVLMGIDIPFISIRIARDATVIVANGGDAPIELGAGTHERGNRIHVWDWSKSSVSRIVPDATFPIGVYALSPDGRLLLTADGEMFNLESGKLSWINLGKAEDRVGAATYLRIGGLTLSADGSHLVSFLHNFDHNPPGHCTGQGMQVFALPAGERLCSFQIADADECPGGFDDEAHRFFYRDAVGDANRLAITPDGQQIAFARNRTHVTRLETSTGNILHEYAPVLPSPLTSMAFSPDGRYLVATQWEPSDLYVWETESGRLLHRVTGERWARLGVREPSGNLCFSPDGKLLAFEYHGFNLHGVTFVMDIESGNLSKSFEGSSHAMLRWSLDGRTIVGVADTYWDDSRNPSEMIYPRIDQWDWRSGKSMTE